MAGDALPLALVHHPRIGKPSHVIVRFALIRALGMVDAGDDGSVPEEVHLQILNVGLGRLESRVPDIGQELLLIADLSVPLSVDEATGDQRIQRRGIPIDLRFIPQALKDCEFTLTRIGLLRRSSRG